MNAIFAVAFFAACVAAQTFDTTTTTDLNRLLLKTRGLNTKLDKFDQLSLADLLRSSGLYGKHYGQGIKNIDSIYGDRLATPWVLPRSYYGQYNQQYDNVNVDRQSTIYTLDEIVRHPLFRQYLTLPLFRQHLSHPLFQYYLTTPLFQQYWTVPQFQTFFQNPYLFYKYVYPVVYNTESTIFDQVKTDSLYPYGRYSGVDVDSSVVDPIVSQYGQYGQYVVPRTHQRGAGILDSLVNRYSSIYGQDQVYGQQRYGQQYGSIFRHHLPYTYVMDKIFKSYFINKPQITEVVTDVKIQDGNNVDEQTYGKIVDPITGEVKYTNGDYNVVDEKIVPVIDSVDQLIGGSRKQHLNVKDALVKRLLLNKMLHGGVDRKFEELYPEFSTETLRERDLKDQIPILDQIKYNKYNKVNRFDVDNILEKINLNGLNANSGLGLDYVDVDETIRTPVTDSDLLLRRPYLNKGLLTRHVPLTKDIVKDFTLTGKYDMNMNTFDKPITKTVIV